MIIEARGLPRAPLGALLGVDVSKYQGRIDASVLVNGGASFLFARVVNGAAPDPEWPHTPAACTFAGLPWGGYGVLRPGNALAQADAFVDVLGENVPLAPVLDLELPGVSLAAARTWLDRVEDRTGRGAIVYTYPSFWESLTREPTPDEAADALAIATRPLWIAHYGVRAPRVPKPWTRATIWQRSGDAKVSPDYATIPGTRRVIDVDVFEGTIGDLLALGRRSPTAQVG